MEYSNSNSNYHEESTNSSELEGADDEENKVDLGVGRSYECVFCKRGFNTAQALGGHMNIHRKDRARNKPKQTAPTLVYPSSNLLGQFRRFSPPHQPHFTYATYFPPAASSSNSTLYESTTTTNDHSDRHPSDPAPGDWRMRLSLEFAPSMINVEDDLHNNRHLQDKELDLELRLGYH